MRIHILAFFLILAFGGAVQAQESQTLIQQADALYTALDQACGPDARCEFGQLGFMDFQAIRSQIQKLKESAPMLTARHSPIYARETGRFYTALQMAPTRIKSAVRVLDILIGELESDQARAAMRPHVEALKKSVKGL